MPGLKDLTNSQRDLLGLAEQQGLRAFSENQLAQLDFIDTIINGEPIGVGGGVKPPFPRGLDTKTAQEINFTQSLLPKSDIIQFATKMAGRAMGDKDAQGFGFMDQKGSIEATRRRVNEILQEHEVAAESVYIDGSFYLQDKKSGDLYLTNAAGNPGFWGAFINDMLPLVGVGAGIAVGATIGSPAVGISALGIGGAAIGEGTSQLFKEIGEGSDLGEIATDVTGTMASSIATDALLGPVVGVLGAGAKVLGKVGGEVIKAGGEVIKAGSEVMLSGGLIKLIPGASKMGKYLTEKGIRLGQLASDALETTTAIGKSLEPLKARVEKASEAYINGKWVQSLRTNPLVAKFNSVAARMEQTEVGSFIFGVDKAIFDKPVGEGAKSQGVDPLKVIIESLENQAAETAKKIQVKTSKLETLVAGEGSQKEKIFGLGSKKSPLKQAEGLNQRIQVLVSARVGKVMQGFKQMLRGELQAGGVAGEISERAAANLVEMKIQIDKSIKEASELINSEITTIQRRGEEAGFSVKQVELEREGIQTDTTYAAKKADIEAQTDSKLNLENFTDKELNEISEQQAKAIKDQEDILAKKLNDPSVNPQEVGRELRDSLIEQWKVRIKVEQDFYSDSLKLALKDQGTTDVTGYIGSIQKSLKDNFVEGDELTTTAEKISELIPNPSEATSKQLLDLKRFFDSKMQSPQLTGASKQLYSSLAESRGKLVSDEGNIFATSGLQPLQNYNIGSALKIERNDALQTYDFASFIGSMSNLKTGKIDRNLQGAKTVFDNYIDLVEDDVIFANRVLDFAGLGPEFNNRFTRAFIKETYNKTGGNAVKTIQKMKTLQGDVGGTGGKTLFNLSEGGSEELELLNNIADISTSKVPVKRVDIPGFQAKQAKLAEEKKLASNELQKRSKQFELETKKSELDLAKATFENVTKPIQERKALLGKVGNMNVNNLSEADQKIVKDLEEIFSGDIGTAKEQKLLESVKKLVTEEPLRLKNLFDEIGLNNQERSDLFRTLVIPNRESASIKDIKGAKFFSQFAEDPVTSVGLGKERFNAFGDEAPVEETINAFRDLERIQTNIPKTEKEITALQEAKESLEKQIAKQTSAFERKQAVDIGKRGAAGVVGGTLGYLLPGGGIAGDIIGSLIGAGLGANKNVRNIITKGIKGTGDLIEGGVSLANQGSLDPAARVALQALEQSTIPGGGTQETLNALLQKATFTQPENQPVDKEELLKLMLGRL